MKDLNELKEIAYKIFEKLRIELFFGKDGKEINEDIDNRVWAYCKGYQDCQSETKDIAIGFAKFARKRSIDLSVAEEQLFNEYLNTLK